MSYISPDDGGAIQAIGKDVLAIRASPPVPGELVRTAFCDQLRARHRPRPAIASNATLSSRSCVNAASSGCRLPLRSKFPISVRQKSLHDAMRLLDALVGEAVPSGRSPRRRQARRHVFYDLESARPGSSGFTVLTRLAVVSLSDAISSRNVTDTKSMSCWMTCCMTCWRPKQRVSQRRRHEAFIHDEDAVERRRSKNLMNPQQIVLQLAAQVAKVFLPSKWVRSRSKRKSLASLPGTDGRSWRASGAVRKFGRRSSFRPGSLRHDKMRSGPDMNHVEAAILDMVARLYPDIFSSLDQYCHRHRGYLDDTIAAFDREVQFYVACLEHVEQLQTRRVCPSAIPPSPTDPRRSMAVRYLTLPWPISSPAKTLP